MASLRGHHFFLIALLPVIALILYIEGQNYDPALIRFQPMEKGVGREAAFFPRELAGFSQRGQVRSFTKENLYEYVNGHAEYFISAGFVHLSVGEYSTRGSEPGEPDVVVDIYDMGKSIQAFSILADEAGGSPSALQAGMMGLKTPQGISFFTGQYYVRISAYDENAPLETFAEKIDVEIGAKSDPFPEFSRLPDLGEVVTTRFIKEAYRGLDFVENVIEREYRINGSTVQVFLVSGKEEEIGKLVASFLDFYRQSEIEYDTIEIRGKRLYKIRDPYEGEWFLIPLPDALFGIFGSIDDKTLQYLVKE